MEIKHFEAEYNYDNELDIVNIKIKENYVYKESIDLDNGIFLDFDINYFPVNLEMLSVSRRLDVEKEFLRNPDGKVKIVVDSDLIAVDVQFRNYGEEYVLRYSNQHIENLKISDFETTFALV